MARCVLAVALAAAALAAMDELPARFHLSPELDGRTRRGVPWRKSVAEAARAAQSVEASPLHGGANNIVAAGSGSVRASAQLEASLAGTNHGAPIPSPSLPIPARPPSLPLARRAASNAGPI